MRTILKNLANGPVFAAMALVLAFAAGPAGAQSRSEVLSVQERLAELGYDPGEADGLLGGQTESAVMAFQSDMGLEETGRITLTLINTLGVHPSDPQPLDAVQARLVDIIGAKWEERTGPAGPQFWEPPAPGLAPAFDDYPWSDAPDPLVEHVDLSSHPDASLFETALDAAVGKPADFAGRFRVVLVGCGTTCQAVILVDAGSGRVIMGPTTEFGVDYRLDSRLMVVNPVERIAAAFPEGEIPIWAGTRWHVFDGTAFHDLSPDEDTPEGGAATD